MSSPASVSYRLVTEPKVIPVAENVGLVKKPLSVFIDEQPTRRSLATVWKFGAVSAE
jgi:hypothetical protein